MTQGDANPASIPQPAADASTPTNPPSPVTGPASIEELNRQKTEVELHRLRSPWWKSWTFLSSIAPLLTFFATAVAAIVAGRLGAFDAARKYNDAAELNLKFNREKLKDLETDILQKTNFYAAVIRTNDDLLAQIGINERFISGLTNSIRALEKEKRGLENKIEGLKPLLAAYESAWLREARAADDIPPTVFASTHQRCLDEVTKLQSKQQFVITNLNHLLVLFERNDPIDRFAEHRRWTNMWEMLTDKPRTNEFKAGR